MKNLKKKDINFLKVFTIYQIVEILVWYLFSGCLLSAFYSSSNVDVSIMMCFSFTFEVSIYGLGFIIQYAIIIILWFLCIIKNTRYLYIIEKVYYSSIDLIISLVIPVIMFVLFSNDNVYNCYVYFLLGFALLIVCSKVAFFKFYEKRLVPQEELPNAKTMEKEYIADNDA